MKIVSIFLQLWLWLLASVCLLLSDDKSLMCFLTPFRTWQIIPRIHLLVKQPRMTSD